MLTLAHLLVWLLPTTTDAQFLVKSPNRSMLDSMRAQYPELPMPERLPEAIPADFIPDTLPDPATMTTDRVIFHSFQLADWAVSLENMFAQNAARATYAKKGLTDQIAVAQKDTATSKESLREMKNGLRQLKSLESEATKRTKLATKTADFGMKLTQMDVDAMRKNLPKMHEQVMSLIQLSKENAALQAAIDLNAATPAQLPKVQNLEIPKTEQIVAEVEAAKKNADQTQKSESKKKEKKPKKQKKQQPVEQPAITETPKTEPATAENPPAAEPSEPTTVSEILNKNIAEVAKKETTRPATFAKYEPKLDVMLHPPAPPCMFVFNGKDEFSGQVRREMRPEVWFTYTNDFMKSYLRDRPHILCSANISAAGNMIFLNLNFSILEQNATKTFGGISKGGQAVLKLMDGQTYPLSSFRQDLGETDESGQMTYFKMQFALDKTVLKKLRQFEVDKIRIGWNKGFEDYEIYSVDLLQRQLNCLEGS